MKNLFIGGSTAAILSRKELKPINAYLAAQYNAHLPENYAYILTRKSNLYACSRKIEELPLQKMRLSAVGLYLGEYAKGEFRLSIEGSQLLGVSAQRNTIELNKEEIHQWMKGESLQLSHHCSGFVIVMHKGDYFGAGRAKENVLLNYVPKIRRLQEIA